MISGIMNAMLQHKKTSAIDRINAAEVNYVINQLKAVGVFIRWFNLMTKKCYAMNWILLANSIVADLCLFWLRILLLCLSFQPLIPPSHYTFLGGRFLFLLFLSSFSLKILYQIFFDQKHEVFSQVTMREKCFVEDLCQPYSIAISNFQN